MQEAKPQAPEFGGSCWMCFAHVEAFWHTSSTSTAWRSKRPRRRPRAHHYTSTPASICTHLVLPTINHTKHRWISMPCSRQPQTLTTSAHCMRSNWLQRCRTRCVHMHSLRDMIHDHTKPSSITATQCKSHKNHTKTPETSSSLVRARCSASQPPRLALHFHAF